MSTSTLPSVAVAGATGHLGCKIAAAFLEPQFRKHFDKIVLLMRKPVADLSAVLGTPNTDGVTVRIYNEESIESSLSDIDIVVCTIGPKGDAFRQKLVRAMANTNVRLYFPSEFGIDHGRIDFSHDEWDHKKAHAKLARTHLTKARVCQVFVGCLIEDSIGPWFGFNTKKAEYEVVGSADTPITFTSLSDAGRVVAQLSLLPENQVPESLGIAGDTKSPKQIAQLMEAAGSSPITIKTLDLGKFKKETLDGKTEDPSQYLRFIMADGDLNLGASDGNENSNQLVNPGQSNWKWKTLEDLAKETNGRPWADIAWPPQ